MAVSNWPKNKQATPCFCMAECPGPGRPYHQYLVGGINTIFEDLNTELWLAKFVESTNGNCLWTLTEPPPLMLLQLDKGPTSEVGWDHEYTWAATVTQGVLGDFFSVEIRWNDSELPVPPRFQPSCDAEFALLNSDLIPKQLNIFPVPDWVCDQDQAREWVAGI